MDQPAVLLIGDAELDDVAAIVEELGLCPARLRRAAERHGWTPPERLLVVSGARALCLPPPRPGEGGRARPFVKVAVVDCPSKTLRARIARMGFDAVVRRPVHHEALRLLIESALHRSREQRVRPRFAVGREVAWRSGLRRRRATLAEISSHGCRLLVPELRRPSRLELLLPRELTGGRELRLRGRVVRSAPRSERGVALTVLFDPPGATEQARLGGLLAHLRSGPPSLAA